MAEEKPHELLIIKRYRGGEEGHHGGAWKIAFADFMTAMMALFLVLWLVSATNEKTKVSIARYFNPVKLVDMSTMKKGVSDPNENFSTTPDPSGDGHPQRAENLPRSDQQPEVPTKEDTREPGAGPANAPTHSEAALFRDPYAVLAEIVAAGEATEAKSSRNSADDNQAGRAETARGTPEQFKDPFKIMVPDLPLAEGQKKSDFGRRQPAASASEAALPTPLAGSSAASMPSQSASASLAGSPSAAPTVSAGEEKASSSSAPASQSQQPPGKNAPASQAVHDDKVNDKTQRSGVAVEAEVTKLQGEIAGELAKIFGKPSAEQALPNVEIKASNEGILISLTDQYNYAMFAIGSAEPQSRTVAVMEKIASILKNHPGGIVIRGHTDGRAYKTASYDNWRLSSARAHMAHYMLTRGGLDEKRIEKIEGYADRRLKNVKDPLADENRRIEILLRKDHA